MAEVIKWRFDGEEIDINPDTFFVMPEKQVEYREILNGDSIRILPAVNPIETTLNIGWSDIPEKWKDKFYDWYIQDKRFTITTHLRDNPRDTWSAKIDDLQITYKNSGENQRYSLGMTVRVVTGINDPIVRQTFTQTPYPFIMENKTNRVIHDAYLFVKAAPLAQDITFEGKEPGDASVPHVAYYGDLRFPLSGWERSAYFDGSSSYVNCGNDRSLTFEDNIFTIEFWMKRASPGSRPAILHKGGWSEGGSEHPYEYSIHEYNNNMRFVVWDDTGVIQYSVSVPLSDVPPGVPFHVAWVNDGITSYVLFNGTVVAHTSIPKGAGMVNTDSSLFVGRAGHNGLRNQFFNGTLDELRIWKVPRSQLDIIDTMNRRIKTSPGMIFRLGFDDEDDLGKDTAERINLFSYNQATAGGEGNLSGFEQVGQSSLSVDTSDSWQGNTSIAIQVANVAVGGTQTTPVDVQSGIIYVGSFYIKGEGIVIISLDEVGHNDNVVKSKTQRHIVSEPIYALDGPLDGEGPLNPLMELDPESTISGMVYGLLGIEPIGWAPNYEVLYSDMQLIDGAHQIDDATLLDDEDGIDKVFEAIGISPYWTGEPWTRVYLYTTPTTDIKSLKLSVQTEFPQNATFRVDGFQLEAVYC